MAPSFKPVLGRVLVSLILLSFLLNFILLHRFINSQSAALPRVEVRISDKDASCDLLPPWMKAYADWHRQNIVIDQVSGETRLDTTGQAKYLIWVCNKKRICNGLGDRVRGIVAALYLAIISKRVLLIDYDRPSSLDQVLQPHCIHWITPTGYAKAKDSEITMDYYDTPDELIHKLEEHKNDRILELRMGPIWKEAAWKENQKLKSYWKGHGTLEPKLNLYYTAFWTLFQWSVEVRSRSDQFRQRMKLKEQPYIAVHWRTGSVQGQEQGKRHPVNNSTLATILDCSHQLQHVMQQCNNTKFSFSGPEVFVASDDGEAKRQIQRLDPTSIRILPDMEILHVDKARQAVESEWITNGTQAHVDAWVELKLLIEADCLVTSRSGFSDMAQLLSPQQPRCFASLLNRCKAEEIKRAAASLGC